MSTRRAFITLVSGAAAWPMAAQAQQPSKMRRLGILTQGSVRTHPTPTWQAFQQGLRDLGWIEGQNLSTEWRFSEGELGPLANLAAELVGLPAEVIVTSATPSTLAAKGATDTIPIVFIQVADAVEAGLVASLGRPGANITGLSTMNPEFGGKRLELLKELLPNATAVAMLWNRRNNASAIIVRALEPESRRLGIQLKDTGVSARNEIEERWSSYRRSL